MKFPRAILSRRMAVTFFLGFSSGVPLLATADLLKAWLKTDQINLSLIGAASLIGLPYTLKFLWSPLVDYYVPPFLGRRRGWMILTQVCLMIALILLGLGNPAVNLTYVLAMALVVTFLSATQDIVLDAHRRDTLHNEELGLGASLFVGGYRVGMIASGAIALILAEYLSWSTVYLYVAACLVVGIVATLLAPEPKLEAPPPRSFEEAVRAPLRDFFQRDSAWLILAFVLLYKLGDNLASSMTIPFYLDIGFTKEQIGQIGKGVGLLSLIFGGIAGGFIQLRIGVYRSLWIFGILQALGVLGFALLSSYPKSLGMLAAVISLENISIGMATAAFVAFMGVLCNARFSATQYALLSSLAGVPRSLISGFTGVIASALGWQAYFVFCALLAIPGLLLLSRIRLLVSTTEEGSRV